jgi:hypothetical protein
VVGSLAAATAPAGASTSAASVTQAAGSGGVNLGPTIAAVEAEVGTVVTTVSNVPLPLLGAVGCVPYYVSVLISGDRPYPCS